MSDLKHHIDALAQLMQESGLREGKLCGADWSVEFAREAPRPAVSFMPAPAQNGGEAVAEPKPAVAQNGPNVPAGTPITTPMMGVYYSSSSPDAPPFVNVGDTVTAGQVVGLVEAMKVFNEITSSVSGKVVAVVASNGALVQPGETLVIIG